MSLQIVAIDPKNPEPHIIKQAAAIILGGGVVAYPTDTAYGLAVNALDETAIGKLFILKQRMQKPLPVIIADQHMLAGIASVAPAERKLMKQYWPGALTIIFKKKDAVPPSLTLGLPTIGVRITNSPAAQALVAACGKPLTATSANITGRGNCYTAECVTRMFQDSPSQPDLVLDAGELPEVPVSTVVQVIGTKLQVLREGPVVPKL
ncbi:MAG: L-threonylcarbamoyladenylate synthase [Patescibacteria group bacterium]|nr:L-threonylcarbamoyladenylate synthase [Patescibacteria group bacterium]MDD5715494.1 L-threonylcarbamoyladenylate synthase [Patescibacteria group bacterium]